MSFNSKFMKKILLSVLFFIFTFCVFSQDTRKFFLLDPTPNVSLVGANGTCAAPGSSSPDVFQIPVSGVGVMSPTNELLLASIGITDCGTGSKNLNEIQFRLISPSGVCVGIYNGGLSTIATGTHYINLVSATTCLNDPNFQNDPPEGSPFTGSGNNGYFNAQFAGVDADYSSFTGNADGTWRLVVSETTSGTPPCLESIRLVFGNPNVISQGTTGDNCNNPILWDGRSPICASTASMTPSSQMPGFIGGIFGTIGSTSCDWNASNDNDVWIKIVATGANTCVAISGVSGVGVNLQSIVVTDAKADGNLDPCTQTAKTATNDPNWQVVSCPRNSIYTTTAGTQKNQQHCFTSEVGKTYYLVVDGDAGDVSKFWIWGYSFSGNLNLTENSNTFYQTQRNNDISVELVGNKILFDFNNKTYNSSVKIYESSGRLILSESNRRKGYSELNLNNIMNSGIYYIKVLVDDKFSSNFTFKIKNN